MLAGGAYRLKLPFCNHPPHTASVFAYLHQTAKDPSALVFTFRTDVFFNVLLPPIIFNAGFSVKKKLFFANFVTLTLFGVLGTFISVAIISGGCHALLHWLRLSHGKHSWDDALALGTILSSTDSVATLQVLKPVRMDLTSLGI